MSHTVLDLFRISGKNALITGANGGIGGAMAEALAEAGANIIIIQIPGDPNTSTKEALAKLPVSVTAYDCDLADAKAIKQTVADVVDRDGHAIDILINCAGVSGHKPILDVDDAFRHKVFSINMNGNYVMTQEVGRRMIARGQGGKILNVSSLAGMVATENISVYAGTKGAVNQFTSAFANEWAKYKITVNCLCPGYAVITLVHDIRILNRRLIDIAMFSRRSLRGTSTTSLASKNTSCRGRQWVDGQFRMTSKESPCSSVALHRTTSPGLGCQSMAVSMGDDSGMPVDI